MKKLKTFFNNLKSKFNFIKKIKENYTVMIIPNSTAKSRQVTIPKVFIYGLVILNITYITGTTIRTFVLSYSNSKLSSQIEKKEETLNNLEIYSRDLKLMTSKQVEELYSMKKDLKNEKALYSERISKLTTMEEDFTHLLDQFNQDNNFDIDNGTSRSLSNARRALKENKEIDQDEFNSLIELDLNNYEEMVSEIDNKIDFLDCKPTLPPVKGVITSGFGPRLHPVTRQYDFHDGIDISNDTGSTVKASGSGIVTFSGNSGSYGNVLIISHGYGYKTIYAHNKTNLIDAGEKVEKGQKIAELGSTGRATGPHVHFEVHKDGKLVNPREILKFK